MIVKLKWTAFILNINICYIIKVFTDPFDQFNYYFLEQWFTFSFNFIVYAGIQVLPLQKNVIIIIVYTQNTTVASLISE